MQLAIAALTHRQVAPRAYDVDVDLGAAAASPAPSPPCTATAWSPSATPASTASTCSTPGSGCWRSPRTGRTTTGPRSPSAARRRGPPRPALLGPTDEEPLALLKDLVAIYDAGRREPLPLPLKTSFAWASARHQTDQPPVEAALKKWKSGMYPAEDAEPAHERVWGPRAPAGAAARPVPAGEETEGEDTRLGALAARLWLPLLRCERTGL